MSKYKGKDHEDIFCHRLMNPTCSFASLDKQVKVGASQADKFLDFLLKNNEKIIKAPYKPSVKGAKITYQPGCEPKADCIVVTDKSEHRISLKTNLEASGIINFSTKEGFYNFLNAFVEKSIPHAIEARDLAMSLFATKIGHHAMMDGVYHRDRFIKEIKNPKHNCPAIFHQALLNVYDENNCPGQYDSIIRQSQKGLIEWITHLWKNYPSILIEYISEGITGTKNFGENHQATANLVVSPDGVYFPHDYVTPYILAKFQKGGSIGRIMKMPRAGHKFNQHLPLLEEVKKFANISTSVHF